MNKRGLFQTVASGSVTQAQTKLSGVDGGATASGGAFVDWGYKYQSDFSAGVNGFGGSGCSIAGNIDSIGGEDNTLRVTVDTNLSGHYASKTILTLGKKYTTTFKYYLPSGQSNIDGIRLASLYWGGTQYDYNVLDTWTTVTVTFTASQTTLRWYATDGSSASFQDAGGDDVFYIKDITIVENPPDKYIGHLLRIKDSAGKQIQGFIKAAGTGETLDSELISSWTNNVTAPFDTFTTSGVDISSAIASTNSRGSAAVAVSNLRLYKYTGTFTKNSGSFAYLAIASSVRGDLPAVTVFTADNGDKTIYRTATNDSEDYLAIYAAGASNFSLTSNSFKQVLTPSATGVTIVSTKGGATYNWFNKNSAFNWNDASGYTYEIVKVNSTVVVVDSNTTAANEHVSLVDGNAFYFGSIDMTNYQDGRHYLWMKDVSGYVAFAKIKAEVPGGFDAPTELMDDTGFDDTSKWTKVGTATVSGGTGNLNAENDILRQDKTKVNNGLYYLTGTFSRTGTATGRVYLSNPQYVSNIVADFSLYITLSGTSVTYPGVLQRSGTGTITIDDFSVKQVTECAATGAHLQNAAGTRNMIYQHPSFNANAIANIKVLFLGD